MRKYILHRKGVLVGKKSWASEIRNKAFSDKHSKRNSLKKYGESMDKMICEKCKKEVFNRKEQMLDTAIEGINGEILCMECCDKEIDWVSDGQSVN